MFSKISKIYLLAFVAFVVIAEGCNATKMLQQTGGPGGGSSVVSSKRSTHEMSTLEAMVACNESFRTSEEFLQELNKTGSFPEEADKTPMCFLKCYLEKTAVISDEGDINEEKVHEIYPTLASDGIDDCKKVDQS
uniref:Uncharacterized protein n=1 Tax=Phlebotomus papatasi TaxID=29031 RepID=A0A1B0DAQ8_PHLPP